jgi:hypothetical protein
MAKSEKADDAPLPGGRGIRKCRGNIEGEKDEVRDRRDNHLYNYKMNVLEGGCYSRVTRFRSEPPVCEIFYVVYTGRPLMLSPDLLLIWSTESKSDIIEIMDLLSYFLHNVNSTSRIQDAT